MNVADTLLENIKGAKKTTDTMLEQGGVTPPKIPDVWEKEGGQGRIGKSVISGQKPKRAVESQYVRNRPIEYYENLGWENVLQLMNRNMTESTRDMLVETAEMFRHPMQTTQGLVGIGRSGASKVDEMLGLEADAPHSFVPIHNELKLMEHLLFKENAPKFDPKMFEAVVDFYKSAYGLGPHGVAGFKQYVSENPAEFVSDFVSIVALGAQTAGAGLRAASAASRARMIKNLTGNSKFLDYLPADEQVKLRNMSELDWQKKLTTDEAIQQYLPQNVQNTLSMANRAEDIGNTLYYIGTGESGGNYKPGAWAKLSESFLRYGDLGALPFTASAMGMGGVLDLKQKSLGTVADTAEEIPYTEQVARYLYDKYKDEFKPNRFTDEDMVELVERISADGMKYDDVRKFTQQGILKKFDIDRYDNPLVVAKKSHDGYDHHVRDEFHRFVEEFPESKSMPIEDSHRRLVNTWREFVNHYDNVRRNTIQDLETRLGAPVEIIKVKPTDYVSNNQSPHVSLGLHGLTRETIRYIKEDLGLPQLPAKFDKLAQLEDTNYFFATSGLADSKYDSKYKYVMKTVDRLSDTDEKWFNIVLGTKSKQEIEDILSLYPEYVDAKKAIAPKRTYFRLEDWDASVMDAFSSESNTIYWNDVWGSASR